MNKNTKFGWPPTPPIFWTGAADILTSAQGSSSNYNCQHALATYVWYYKPVSMGQFIRFICRRKLLDRISYRRALCTGIL